MEISQESIQVLFQNSSHVLKSYELLENFEHILHENMLYMLGIPQASMNLCVIVILLLGFTIQRVRFDPGLVFLLNLAVADFLQSCLFISFVIKHQGGNIQHGTESELSIFNRFDGNHNLAF